MGFAARRDSDECSRCCRWCDTRRRQRFQEPRLEPRNPKEDSCGSESQMGKTQEANGQEGVGSLFCKKKPLRARCAKSDRNFRKASTGRGAVHLLSSEALDYRACLLSVTSFALFSYGFFFRYRSNQSTVRCMASIWFSRLVKPWPSSA